MLVFFIVFLVVVIFNFIVEIDLNVFLKFFIVVLVVLVIIIFFIFIIFIKLDFLYIWNCFLNNFI